MADLAPVGASVTVKNNSGNDGENDPTIGVGISGEAYAAGDLIYRKSDDKYWKVNTTEEVSADFSDGGIAICPADAADDAAIFASGDGDRVDLGVPATEGTEYYASDNANGKIAPYADVASGKYKSRIGIGNKAGELVIDKKITGETKT